MTVAPIFFTMNAEKGRSLLQIQQKKNTFEKAGIHFIENVDEIGKQILNTINKKKGNQ